MSFGVHKNKIICYTEYMKQSTENIAERHYAKMTETPVAKLVITLGIPTTISMLITNLYNMADTYFVGQLGDSQQGAIGVLFTLQSIIQAMAFMLGHGSGSFVAKELADKDVDKASEYVSSAFFLGGALGVIFSVISLCVLSPFMKFLGSTDTILPYAKDYGMWVLISCPFLICSLILNNCLRYEGKAFYAMIGLVSGALLNILGDYVLISVCGMGVFGAGMSTAISQIVSFAILLVLYLKKAQSRISFKKISKNVKLYLSVCKVGLPSLIRQGLNTVSSGLLNNMAKLYGGQISKEMADATIAGMSVVNRCSSFIMCVGLGVGQGLQPVASFNYEVKQYQRVKKALLVTTAIGFGAVALLCIPVYIFSPQIVAFFRDSEMAIKVGAPALRYATIGLLFVPIFTPINMLYQSIRKAWIASFLSLLRNGLTFIPVLLLTTHLWGITGIQISQPIADVLTGIISIPFFIYFLKLATKLTKKQQKETTQEKETVTNEEN